MKKKILTILLGLGLLPLTPILMIFIAAWCLGDLFNDLVLGKNK